MIARLVSGALVCKAPPGMKNAMPTRPLLALLLLALAAAPVRAETEAEKQGWIAYNQDLLKKRLADPESARFRNVFFSRKAGVPVACGEVKLPEVADFQRFVGAGSVGVFLPGDMDDFDALWGHFCR